MKFKPKSKDELYSIIKEIIINQEKIPSYPYGLKDVDTSLITNMSKLFSCYVDSINYKINIKIDWEDPRNNIGNWDVSNVTDMNSMFYDSSFNQNINLWNISCIINMNAIFSHSIFNQPLDNWNISNALFMNGMFYNSKFNQDISKWVLKLNKDSYINILNKKSIHEENYGTINSYEDFIKIYVTKNFIDDTFKNGNDIEKFKLLKILKKYPDIIKDLDIDKELK